jgi:hypothetical protein
MLAVVGASFSSEPMTPCAKLQKRGARYIEAKMHVQTRAVLEVFRVN